MGEWCKSALLEGKGWTQAQDDSLEYKTSLPMDSHHGGNIKQ
jgi:hypothetical protein